LFLESSKSKKFSLMQIDSFKASIAPPSLPIPS
jgi:hypothetical protein